MKRVVIKRKDRIEQNNIEQYELEEGRKEQNERKLRNGKKRTLQKWVGKVSEINRKKFTFTQMRFKKI